MRQEKTEKKRFLITGITGFCGPHLANLLLKEGHEVVGLTRRTNGMQTDILDVVKPEDYEKIKWVIADLTDRDSLLRVFENEIFDGCFHLAAMSLPPQSFIDPIGTFKENIIGSANLIDVIEKTHGLNCKLMFCSSSEVYGNFGKTGVAIKESDPMIPANPYGLSKTSIDLYMQERFANEKITGFVTRAFSHTGPRRGRNFSISSDAYQIAQFMLEENAEKAFELRVGNLKTSRCLLHVHDVCRAYYLLMQSEKSNGKVFNVSGTAPHKMEEFTDMLIKISSLKNVTKKIDPALYRKHDIAFQFGSNTALKSLTQWQPEISIEETIASLLDYWITKLTQS